MGSTTRIPLWLLAALAVGGLSLSGCARAPEEVEAASHEVKVERYKGTNVVQVEPTSAAAKRLGIRTSPVREMQVAGSDAPLPVIASAAVLYDPHGRTWVYSNPERLVFVRVPIVIDHVQGEVTVLKEGPAVGTQVVTAGAALLLGAETGVGEE